MLGVRFDQFLASTAIALLVAGTAGGQAVKPAPAATVTEAPATTQPVTATGGDEVPVVVSTPPAEDSAAPTQTPANGTAPATAPAAGTVAETTSPVAEQLRELANGKFDRMIGGGKERAAFEAYYGAHNYAPIWITDGKLNERAKAAIAYLGQVDVDALIRPIIRCRPSLPTATRPRWPRPKCASRHRS